MYIYNCPLYHSDYNYLQKLPHYILPYPLVEGVVEVRHSGDVEALLTQHLELDINLTTEGGVTRLPYTIIRWELHT